MGQRWRGVLTLEGIESSDHRILEVVTWRELPLTLRIQTEDFGAHDGASPVGRIDTLEIQDGGRAFGTGEFSESPEGELAAQWVGEQVLRGVSVDPGAIEYVEELIDPATGAVVSMEQIYETWDQIDAAQILGDEAEEARLIEWLESLYYRIRFTAYEIAAATLVATPAFAEAVIELVPAGEAQPADGTGAGAPQAAASIADRLAVLRGSGPSTRQRLSALLRPSPVAVAPVGRMVASGARSYSPFGRPADPVEELITGEARQAAAARLAVAVFAPEVFERQQLSRPTKWTIDPDGRMHGHLFTWEGCHRSVTSHCETVAFMRADIEAGAPDFHVGDAHLIGGGKLTADQGEGVGVLTYADLHAPGGQLTVAQLQRLIEDTGSQLGPVRLYPDKFGVQACGRLWDDVPPTQAGRCLAGFPSYDSRQIRGVWRLFGLHVVNTPGQTMVQEAEGQPLRMVASLASNMAAPEGACACGGAQHAAGAPAGLSEAGAGLSCSCGGSLARKGPSSASLAELAALDAAMAQRRRLARTSG